MSFQQLLDLLIYENALKFRMEVHGLGASLHLTEWWIYPKSARQALTAGKDATPVNGGGEARDDLTPSLMELMTNSVRPAILSWFFSLYLSHFFNIEFNLNIERSWRGPGNYNVLFWVIFQQQVNGSEFEWDVEWGYRAKAKNIT